MPPLAALRFCLLCLFGCSVRGGYSKALNVQDVSIKVQVFDNGDLSPLAEAAVGVYVNQSWLAAGTTDKDGVALITFKYHLGTRLVVSAAKYGFVTNSAPWHVNKTPLFTSVCLYLLPERPATLMLFDDVVQILLGSPGAKSQPCVQFQRKNVRLPENTSYSDLSAFLTTTTDEVERFPYLLGYETDKTVNRSRIELTPVAAISIHLFTSNGSNVKVSGPIQVSIPLPTDSLVTTVREIPAWRFDKKIGAWVSSGTGMIKRDGSQLTWSYLAPQLGYWVAAMLPLTQAAVSPSRFGDITTYHTIFLLTILGALALLVLVLVCLLLYYCRRRCLKPRQQHRKLQIASTLDSSKKDQATSMSHINLISTSHLESVSSNGDMDVHTPILKSAFSTSREFESSREEFFKQIPYRDPGPKMRHINKASTDTLAHRGNSKEDYHRTVESFPLKAARSMDASGELEPPLADDYRHSYSSMVSQQPSDEKGREVQARRILAESKLCTNDPPSPPPLPPPFESLVGHKMDNKPSEYMMSQSVDHLARPTTLSQPGQLIFCGSIDHMKDNMYRNVMPTLVIPAHYVGLTSDYPCMDQSASGPTEQLEMKGVQMGVPMSHQPVPQQYQHQQVQQSTPQSDDGEDKAWGPHSSSMSGPMAVLLNESAMAQMNGELQALTEKKFLELGVKPQHPRAWFVSLDGRSNAHVRHSYIDLQTGERIGSNDASLDSGVDVNEAKPSKKLKEERDRHGPANVAYSKLVYVDDNEQSSSECRTAVCSPEDNSLTPLLEENSEHREAIHQQEHSRGNSMRSSTSETRRDSTTSPEEEMQDQSEGADDQGENKKSPWQKREERPLMVFNLK
ncbi:protein FAM171A2 isoform X2 [Hypanus sabinus]|uniref:protein FAM171A2 isoform X2 n=1 Tax=Hypanus sabinus TaxID=79690 RepID=UPI0028C4DAEE|nr:protein FAM171A2 isoform X2 [Hypanus sabinus]